MSIPISRTETFLFWFLSLPYFSVRFPPKAERAPWAVNVNSLRFSCSFVHLPSQCVVTFTKIKKPKKEKENPPPHFTPLKTPSYLLRVNFKWNEFYITPGLITSWSIGTLSNISLANVNHFLLCQKEFLQENKFLTYFHSRKLSLSAYYSFLSCNFVASRVFV